jgi:hypothetical protein
MGWSVRFATVDSRIRTHSHVHGKPISGAPEAQVCRLCGPAQLIAPWLPYSSLASVQLERDMCVGQFSFARVVSRIRNRCHVSCGAISRCSASTAQVSLWTCSTFHRRASAKIRPLFNDCGVRTTNDCPTTATPPEPGVFRSNGICVLASSVLPESSPGFPMLSCLLRGYFQVLRKHCSGETMALFKFTHTRLRK